MSRGMSAPAYWLSASVLTMMSAPAFRLGVDAGHERRRQSLVPAEPHDVVDAVGARHLGRPVRRPVVDDDRLDRVNLRDGLRQVRQRPWQGVRLVQARNLNDELRHATSTRRSTTPSQVIVRARS